MMRHRRKGSVVTLLHSAASERSEGVFEETLGALELELTPEEVLVLVIRCSTTMHGAG